MNLQQLLAAKVAASQSLANAANNLNTTRQAADAARATYFVTPNQANLNAWNNAESALTGAAGQLATATQNYCNASDALDAAIVALQ